MPGQSQPSGQPARRARPLVLLLAAGWLALMLLVCVGASAVGIASASPPLGNPTSSCTPTPPATACPTPSDTPTNTPTAATATSTISATATPTGTGSTPTVTATDTPTATGGQTGGGYTSDGNQNGGAQPTKVVLAQPTVSSGSDSPLGSLSPGAISSNGLLLATSLSCVVAILGLIVAVIAMSRLINGGYGPFLKVLVLGKRAGGPRGKAGAVADAYGDGGDHGDWGSSGAYEYDGSAEYAAQHARVRSRNGNAGNGSPSSGYRNGNGRQDGYEGPRSGPPGRRPPAQRTRDLREW